MADNRGSSDFLAGFVVGSLVGVALGMLLTPRPGEETRVMLAEQSERWRHRAGGLSYPEAMDSLSDQARLRVETLREHGLDAIEARIAAAQDAIDAAQAQLREIVDEQKARVRDAVQEGQEAATKKREELLGKLDQTDSTSS